MNDELYNDMVRTFLCLQLVIDEILQMYGEQHGAYDPVNTLNSTRSSQMYGAVPGDGQADGWWKDTDL